MLPRAGNESGDPGATACAGPHDVGRLFKFPAALGLTNRGDHSQGRAARATDGAGDPRTIKATDAARDPRTTRATDAAGDPRGARATDVDGNPGATSSRA